MALPKSTSRTTGATVSRRGGKKKFADLAPEEQRARIDRAERAGRLTTAKAAAAREYWDLPSKEAVVWAAQNQWEPVPPTKPKPEPKKKPPKTFAEAMEANRPKPYRASGRPGARSSAFDLARQYNWAIGAPARPEAQRMMSRTMKPERREQREEGRRPITTRDYGGDWTDFGRYGLDPRPSLNALRTSLASATGYTGERDITSWDPRKNFASAANAIDAFGDWGEESLKAAPGQARALGSRFADRMREAALGGPTDLGTKEERQRRLRESVLRDSDPVGGILKEIAGPTLVESISTGSLPGGRGGKAMLALEAAGVFPVGKLGRGVVEGIKAAQAVERGAKAGVVVDTIGKSLGGEMLVTTAAKGAVRGAKKGAAKVAARPPAVLNVPERAAAHAAIDATGERATATAAKAALDDQIQTAVKGMKNATAAEKKAAAREAYREVQEAVEADLRGGGARGAVTRVEGPLPIEETVDVSDIAQTGLSGPDIARADLSLAKVTGGVDMSVFREEGVAKLIPRLKGLLQAGEGGRLWYERSARAILQFAGGDKELAKKYAQVVAIMSAQRNPFENIELATEALRQLQVDDRVPVIYKGKKIGESSVKVGTGPQRVKAQQIMDGVPWEGRKTDRFYRNMAEDIDSTEDFTGEEVTNDIWQARLFGLKDDHPTAREYEAISQLTRNIADALGWKPKQVQAALWGPIRAEVGEGSKAMSVAEGMQDFSHALARESAQIPIEPGPGLQAMGGTAVGAYRALAPEERGAFDAEINEALQNFLRKSGALALLGEREPIVSNAYVALMPTKMTGKGVLGPRSREALDAVTTMAGDALGHDAASWFRPKHIKNVPKGRQNGTHVAGLGRKLTEGEESKIRFLLEKRLGGDVQMPSGPDGSFYVLNFSKKTKNAQFQDIVDDVLSGVLADSDVETRGFFFQGKNYKRRADGSYPDQRTAWARRPAVQGSLDELRTAVGDVHRRRLGLPGPDPTPQRLRGYEQPGDPGVLVGQTERGAPTGPQEMNVAARAEEGGTRKVSPSARGMEEEPHPKLTGKERTNALARRRRLAKKVNPTEEEVARLRVLEQQLGVGGGPRLEMATPISAEEMQTILKRTKKRPRMTAAEKAAAADPNQINLFGEDLAPTPIQDDDLESQLREMLRRQQETGEIPRSDEETRARVAQTRRRIEDAEDPETERLLEEMGYGEGDPSMEALKKQVKAARAKAKPRKQRAKKKPPGQEELDLGPRKPGRAPAARQHGPQEAPGPPRKPGRAPAERQHGPQERPGPPRKPGRGRTARREREQFRQAMAKPRAKRESVLGKPVSRRSRESREFTQAVAAQRRKPGSSILRKTVAQRKAAAGRPTTRMYPRPEAQGRVPSAPTQMVPRTPVSESPVARSVIESTQLRWKGHQFFDQGAVNDLFDEIRRNPDMTPQERNDAIFGLLRALKGQAAMNKPAQRALKKAFGADGERIVKQIRATTPAWGHAARAGIELYNLPRSLMTFLDLSAAGIQAIMALPAYPKEWARNFGAMHNAFRSKRVADDLIHQIESDPMFDRGMKAGVGASGANRREMVSSGTYAERIPTVLGGGLVRGSVRSFDAFLSKLRFDAWKNQVRIFTEAGRYQAAEKKARIAAEEMGASPERTEELVRAAHDHLDRQIAVTVNNATGYGSLGSAEGTKAAEFMSQAFFSPRYLASRLQVINPWWYLNPKIDRRIRRQRLMTATKAAIGMGSVLYLLDQVDGVEAVYDPRSKKFGHVKFGDDMSMDITAGQGQAAALLIQIASGVYKNSQGEERSIGGLGRQAEFGGKTAGSVIFDYFRGKAAPVPATAMDWIHGKDLGYQEHRTKEQAAKDIWDNMHPLIVQDMVDAVQQEGWGALGLVLPAIYGFSPNTPPKIQQEEEEEEFSGPPRP